MPIFWTWFNFFPNLYLRNKKKHSLDDWLGTAKKDLRRLTNLAVKGKFKDIVYPADEINNYQKIVKYNKKVFDSTLKNTLNTTIQDIGKLALQVPKNITKNLICFKPYVLRFWRQRQAKQRQMNSEKQIIKSMRSQGKVLSRNFLEGRESLYEKSHDS